VLSSIFAAGQNLYKVGTADEHLRVRSRALVHGYCVVSHSRLDPPLVSEPSGTRICGHRNGFDSSKADADDATPRLVLV
jgi:hypothetical protein